MSDDRSTPDAIMRAARNYFDKGRCSGHSQFNGRYCRDEAGPERWCIHCAGFMLLTLLDAERTRSAEQAQEIERLKADLERDRAAHLNTIDQLEAAETAADELAYAIAPMEAIGEHSNLNNPWTNALDELGALKERADAWGLLNQARALDQRKVAALSQQLAQKDAEIAALRAALVGVVGASEPDELEAMELVMRSLLAPEPDVLASINAISVLRQFPAVLPREDQE